MAQNTYQCYKCKRSVPAEEAKVIYTGEDNKTKHYLHETCLEVYMSKKTGDEEVKCKYCKKMVKKRHALKEKVNGKTLYFHINCKEPHDTRDAFYIYMQDSVGESIYGGRRPLFNRLIIDGCTYEALLHAFKAKEPAIKIGFPVNGWAYVAGILKKQIPESKRAIELRHKNADNEKNLPEDEIIYVKHTEVKADQKAIKPNTNRVANIFDLNDL